METKSSEELTAWLALRLKMFPLDRRPISGYPVWLFRGHVFALVYGDVIGLRLPPALGRDFLEDYPNAGPFIAKSGRIMKYYVSFHPRMTAQADDPLDEWFRQAFRTVAVLPERKARIH